LGEDGNDDGDILDELMGLGGEELLTPPPAGAGGGASSSRTPTPPPPRRGPGRPRSAEPGRRSRTPEQRAHNALMDRHRRATKTAERVAEAELRTLEWVHDASGSAITANSRRLRTLPPGDARDQAKSDVAVLDRFVNVDLESRAVTSSGCVGVWFACGRRVTSSGCVGVRFACVGALCARCVACSRLAWFAWARGVGASARRISVGAARVWKDTRVFTFTRRNQLRTPERSEQKRTPAPGPGHLIRRFLPSARAT